MKATMLRNFTSVIEVYDIAVLVVVAVLMSFSYKSPRGSLGGHHFMSIQVFALTLFVM